MNQEELELNGKKVSLENISLEDVEQLFDFDKTVLLMHRLELGKQYFDTHFPENQKLFKRVQKSIKRNIKLTDPKTFKSPKGVITYSQLASKDLVNEKMNLKRKDVVKRMFKKKNKKTKKQIIDERINQLNDELKKTGMN